MLRLLFVAALCSRFSIVANGETAVSARELPRFPHVEAARAHETFQIKRGFRLELAAAEPDVASPIAICFDEESRLFVLEMRDYPETRDEKPHLGRVRLLEDRDGDGRYERSTIFAADFPWPTALIWANGGLFVCAAPDIWRLEDEDGDGETDVRRVVFTGFNSGVSKLNVQALPNCFAWGPDNRIHLQTGGGNRGVIRSAARPEMAPEEIAGRDFWFDPRTLAFGFEAGGGQYGMSYDDAGRRFVCNNSDHLRTFLFDDRYAARNSFSSLASPLVSVAADGPAAEVFRISPDEPWRVVRTRWRVAGKAAGPVEGGGRVSGYFTGATGTTVFRGDAFGADFVGNTFTGDAGGNLVHRKVLRADGVSVAGERPPDERNEEFLASRDTWFRPVSFANAPDGTLYVVDMYREVIEHPWSIPEAIKQHLDLTSGRERGRIWQIVPESFKRAPLPNLKRAPDGALVALLAHSNGWHRDTATRLLGERRDPATLPLLMRMVREDRSALARLHALRVLDAVDGLRAETIVHALGDPDPVVREQAVRLSEKVSQDGRALDEIWNKLATLVMDQAPRVRLQLALTLSEFSNDGLARSLAALARRDAGDRWISSAIRSTSPPVMAPLFAELIGELAPGSPGMTDFLAQLATAIGARGVRDEIEEVLQFASASETRLAIVASLREGMARHERGPEEKYAEGFAPLFERARAVLRAPDAGDGNMEAAARLLAHDRSEKTRDALLETLRLKCPPRLLRAIFGALDERRDADIGVAILRDWATSDGAFRAEAMRFLLQHPQRTETLLKAIAGGKISVDELSAADRAQLRQHREPGIARAASKLFPTATAESRAAIIQRFTGALDLPGDATKGRPIFQERCASCHRFRGEGHLFGPDLESVAGGGREKLLTHLIDPDREVAPQFAAYTIELNDGGVAAGIIATESPEGLVLHEPLGRETVLRRADIRRRQTTGRSPMPEGLEAGLAAQDLANLFEFLAPKESPAPGAAAK